MYKRQAMFGALCSLLVAIRPLVIRTDVAGANALPAWMNLGGIDYVGDPDPVLFFGTVASDLMSESFGVLFAGLFARGMVGWI